MIRKSILFVFIVSLFACKEKHDKDEVTEVYDSGELISDTGIRHAKRFSISENEKYKVIYLFGTVDIQDTTARYIILKDTNLKISRAPRTFVIKPPCKKIASLSSVYTSMLYLLDQIDNISAIENIDYYTNPDIIKKFNEGNLKELVKSPLIDTEKTISLSPDVIFSFGMGNPDKELDRKLVMAGIPIIVAVDHLEETPLARAEWIKFFAAFVNKEQKADSIFKSIEQNYIELKKLALHSINLPMVLTEIRLGEIWYVPGGKSFAATFIKDANAKYIWNENEKSGSLHLSFEEVFSKAREADFWLNMAMVSSVKELLAQESRYSQFKAFKEGKLYNNIKNVNAKGYSDYWETGIIYPDRVLSDLVQIFHPELKGVMKNGLFYYKKLE
jgi:iron complex transport system substrate-binding protein